ncbi:hypothetical protein Tdes44962_MAKER01730 [Teratosphaeria destructans]|uniref:Uncharacterized protein n=1 Tax=Teratosphaeria destructans TaxID=418781 RepID=A0A9W7SXQ1_9PEZI|nr:hypothetical protein Tdes44962_MAKER01730 [Teratosphaeria destructans]
MRSLLAILALLPFAAAGTNLWRGFYCANPVPGGHAKDPGATKAVCDNVANARHPCHWSEGGGKPNKYCWQNTGNDWLNGVWFRGLCLRYGASFGVGVDEKP